MSKINLKDTASMMQSPDYKERFKAEYWQLKIRYDKLDEMLAKYKSKKLGFTPSCDIKLLKMQFVFMGQYLRVLKKRAKIEEIDLK